MVRHLPCRSKKVLVVVVIAMPLLMALLADAVVAAKGIIPLEPAVGLTAISTAPVPTAAVAAQCSFSVD
ncbi:hypothetical protein E2562_009931 [Oryza meyeriana var. granulata]|uniref:Uncharacterized protein n=1 Tax=Oryza meyeriana var. granulata TaxID=110450 RepID=A0A6G1BUG5_9ORYZ|nr:hypothetical protein E2562_009931 [Oryza meyeriana var. granulata]